MFVETLRIDYSNHFLGMRVNFWIALLLCLGGLLWFVAIQRGWRLGSRRRSATGVGADQRRKAQRART